MDQSVGPTIKKIKLQEQDIEAKLKKKREHEAELALLNQAIRDAISEAEKYNQEQLQLTKKIDLIRPQLEIEKLRRVTLIFQLMQFTEILDNLKIQSDQGITKVWNLRSSLCETVQRVSDKYDIRALVMRPICTNPLPQDNSNNVQKEDIVIMNKDKLNAAHKRRDKAIADRDTLQTEPETGEEFIRIKNALRYSMEKMAKS